MSESENDRASMPGNEASNADPPQPESQENQPDNHENQLESQDNQPGSQENEDKTTAAVTASEEAASTTAVEPGGGSLGERRSSMRSSRRPSRRSSMGRLSRTGESARLLEETVSESLSGGEAASAGSAAESEEGEDFEYDEKDLISGPRLSEGCTVPDNILEFQYSFGYECQLHSNLCVLDPDTVAFVSGELIQFFRISDRKMWFRRSAGGTGLGHIAKNPQHPHFAVGERGKRPRIIIYEWPSLKIVALLKKGAQRSYTYLNYSSDGDLLCSMAGPPDNFFTVWDWRESRIMLRAKSSGQDVFHASFSSYMPGHITTAGSAHVRFWRMAETFTGLKLEGAQGRFGNTEVSDVIGVLAMPDGKVVSGCEWGNILIWEAGLIKSEVTKKGRKSCHNAPIAQFEYFNGELLSLGMDGFVRVWYFETIDLADPPDDDRFVEVEPIFELEVADELNPAALTCIQRKNPALEDDNTWIAQDGGGGLWQLDLSLSPDAAAPQRLFTCHGHGVAGLAVAPSTPFVATLGKEGRLHVYSPAHRGLLVARTFPAPGQALLWLPTKVASCGLVLVLASADGVLRVVAVDLAAAGHHFAQHRGTALGTADFVTLLQASKAHSQAATALALSDSGRVLASGGADRTVFLFNVESKGAFAALAPIGFVQLDDAVTFLTFRVGQDSTVLAGCEHGQVAEVKLTASTHNAGVSYRLGEEEVTVRTLIYKSVKAGIRREEYRKKGQRRKDRKLEKKRRQLERVKLENPGIEIDEEAYLEDSDPEEDLGQLQVPDVLGAVCWVRYAEDDEDTVWLSITGFDAGYLYKYRFGHEDPVEYVPVPDDDDLEVSSYLNYEKKYLFLGMGNGELRCVRIKDDPKDISDYWSLGMHKGAVALLTLSPDSRTLYSAGPDGNVFMYGVHPEGGDPPARVGAPSPISTPAAAEELYSSEVPTLEEQCAKAENDRKMRVAAEHMQRSEQVLWGLAATYNNIIKRNRQLPASQQIPQSELELDPRITPSTRMALEAEADLLRRKLAFPLEKATLQYRKLADLYTDAVAGHGIKVYAVRKKGAYVETIRQRKLREEFIAARALVQFKKEDALRRGRTVEIEMAPAEAEEEVVLAPAPVESFLRGISAFEHKFNARLRRLLDKYHSRKFKRERRNMEWAQFMRKKPDMNRTDPADEQIIREAEESIGDYKLKSDPTYKVPANQVVTTVTKYDQLLRVREQLDELLGSFNAEVLALRQRKADLRERMAAQEAELKRMHLELPEHLHLSPPEPPTVDIDAEYPERQFEISEEEIEAEMDRAAPSRRQGRAVKAAVESTAAACEDPVLEVLRGTKDVVLEIGEKESLSMLLDTLMGLGASASDAGVVAEVERVESDVEMSALRALGKDDSVNTPWEDELRAQRLIRKVWEQRQLVDAMNREVDAVDAAVEALAAKRLEVQRDATLLRHHLLVLHQELIIIKECEEREEFLCAKVVDNELACREVQNEINAIQNKLDGKARDIVRCQEREKELQLAFVEAVGDNRYVDYLKKIFKKKYKPPRATDAGSSLDTSSSSSSSEEDEQDEGASLESNEIGLVRYDESNCPPDCSKDLFDLTLRLRAQRHETERDVVDLQKDIEHLRKDQDAAGKRLVKVEEELAKNEAVLQDFRSEKQQRLNKVDTIVVLRLSQLQHSVAAEHAEHQAGGQQQQQHQLPKFEQLENTLVFNTTVLSDLDRRKQQLDDEATAQRAKHKKNRTHLHRMVVDVRYMRARLKTLKEQIEEAQYRKFGCVVDMTELEQALLKKFIWDLRSSSDDIRKEFAGLIKSIQADVRAKFTEYKETVVQNTERQNLLLVLIEERNRLKAAVARSERKQDLHIMADEESPLDEDIPLLQALLERLRARRDALLAEAVRLRQKGPLPPLAQPGAVAEAQALRGMPSVPGPSSYHGHCGPEPIPPPPKPWPPACVSAFKYPMYLGGRPPREEEEEEAARPATSTSAVSRREEVRVQLALGEDGPPEVRHPHPTQRQRLDSIALPGTGLLRADMRDIPAIPSEEELMATGQRAVLRGEDLDQEDVILDFDEDGDEEDFEELYRRDAMGTVEGFLERLGSQDGGENMMRMERDPRGQSSASDAVGVTESDAEPESDADVDPITDVDADVHAGDDTVAEVDDGIELVKGPTQPPRGGSTDEDD